MQAKKRPSTATSPSTQTYMQGASTSNAKAKQPDKQKGNKLKRPDTAPASSTVTSDALHLPSIPFPVVIEGLDANTEQETERQRTTSKLSTTKKKTVPERLQPASSLRSSSSTLVLPTVGSGEEGNESGSVGDSAAGDGSRLSWHPYARVGGGGSPELMFSSPEIIVKREQSDIQPQSHPASRAERSSPPTSPTAFNSSGSGSGSESSTRSPITPMSPLFWATPGTVYEGKGAVPSGVGIGLGVKITEGAQVESQNEKKTPELEMDLDGSGGSCNELLKVVFCPLLSRWIQLTDWSTRTNTIFTMFHILTAAPTCIRMSTLVIMSGTRLCPSSSVGLQGRLFHRTEPQGMYLYSHPQRDLCPYLLP